MHSLSLRASLVAVAKDKANVGGRGTRIEMVLLFCGHPGPKRREENPPLQDLCKSREKFGCTIGGILLMAGVRLEDVAHILTELCLRSFL